MNFFNIAIGGIWDVFSDENLADSFILINRGTIMSIQSKFRIAVTIYLGYLWSIIFLS